MAFSRIVWVVLDSVGIGALPDAEQYGDAGRNTLGHIAQSRPLAIPNLVRLGLANIEPLAHLWPASAPSGFPQGLETFARRSALQRCGAKRQKNRAPRFWPSGFKHPAGSSHPTQSTVPDRSIYAKTAQTYAGLSLI